MFIAEAFLLFCPWRW